MRKLLAIAFILLTFNVLKAQVQVRELPRMGYEQRIRSCLDTMKIVDTHEHLESQKGIAASPMCDFMLLLHQYSDDDIKSAGMSKPTFATLLKDSLTVMQKWGILKPYWEKSFNTSYNRAVLLTSDSLFGIKNLDETTVTELSKRIKKAYQSDWYNTILKEKCNIEFLINDGTDRSFGDTSMMRYTQHFYYTQINSKKKLDQLSRESGNPILSIDDLDQALKKEFDKRVKTGFTCVKISDAYFRSLYFEDVSKEKAGEVFDLVLQGQEKELPIETIKPLSDYMMHRILDLALKYNKPVQIHTGLQAGDGNYIMNSNPALLANLFLKYRDVQFALFHGGYPYGGELASLAKNFRNVYIDLCWLYIISPSYSERYLHEWLETVPASKILGFGGDYENVENIYGHLLFARQIVSNVLTAKVKDGYFTEAEAIRIAGMIMHDNAVNLFRLK
ncbi:MAG TPA: amidohydrolase family protein [Prolixibacteraceae bacterium]|nr:amidohydrolase family protein [Prolixibacteraceae bacterium]